MKAKKLQGKIEKKVLLAGNNWYLMIRLEEEVEYIPGQFVSLKVSEEGLRRSYSVAGRPSQAEIELVIDVTPMGTGSKYVLGLKEGDTVEVLGFLGKFVVTEEILNEKKEIFFVGTGAGVVPFKPIIEDLLVNKKYQEKICLIWGMRYETDLFWLDVFKKWQSEYENFRFELILSKPDENWQGRRGHVGDVLDQIKIEGNSTVVYLCGNPEMITEMKERLLSLNVPEKRILQERFA